MKLLFLLLLCANLLFAATIKTLKDSYYMGEVITVNVTGLPNANSWVGLFYAYDESEPENLLAKRYATKEGSESFTFPGLDDDSEYEVRLFFNNSYEEQGYYNFEVTADDIEIDIKTFKDSYRSGESIKVHVAGLPGNNHDWIALFEAYNESFSENIIEKIETKGIKEGDFTFRPLHRSGTYEVRAFVNGSFGEMAYYSFEVKPNIEPVTVCNILQNPSFEKDTDGWILYGNSTLVKDSHTGSMALRIKESGLDQMSQKITGDVDTYQFNGYYKTVGKTDGIWAGMVFYDEDKNFLFEKSTFLVDSSDYRKFILNATSTPETRYVEVWFWADGKVILDDMRVSTLGCYNYTVASSLPPKGLKPDQVPQFVVLGFDDNTRSDAIEWVIDLFKDKRNHDGSKARVSFYANTTGLHHQKEDDPVRLLNAMKKIVINGHELGNHTDNHFIKRDDEDEEAFFRRIKRSNISTWRKRIDNASNDLMNLVGISKSKIKGFRAPYLLYTDNSMSVLKENDFLYDCSVEEGYSPEFDGTNFRWPYQLNKGSPGLNESWYGNEDNPERVKIKEVNGLWELPNHVLMIPKDSECRDYGIKVGLWSRLKNRVPYIEDHKITGLDYNLWSLAKVNKAEMLGILKYNLDLRLKGNRAPFMFGTHSQYYTKEWADSYAPNATVNEMRSAIREFIDYALSKDEVRIKRGVDIIEWCKNPKAL